MYSFSQKLSRRYVKITFLTHYGSQYYCPVSVVRIHGTSHVTNLKEKLISNSKEVEQRVSEIKKQQKTKEGIIKDHAMKEATASPIPPVVINNDDPAAPRKDTAVPKEADLIMSNSAHDIIFNSESRTELSPSAAASSMPSATVAPSDIPSITALDDGQHPNGHEHSNEPSSSPRTENGAMSSSGHLPQTDNTPTQSPPKDQGATPAPEKAGSDRQTTRTTTSQLDISMTIMNDRFILPVEPATENINGTTTAHYQQIEPRLHLEEQPVQPLSSEIGDKLAKGDAATQLEAPVEVATDPAGEVAWDVIEKGNNTGVSVLTPIPQEPALNSTVDSGLSPPPEEVLTVTPTEAPLQPVISEGSATPGDSTHVGSGVTGKEPTYSEPSEITDAPASPSRTTSELGETHNAVVESPTPILDKQLPYGSPEEVAIAIADNDDASVVAAASLKAGASRLVLEELPQLKDEDFTTQESIFSTLANRSTLV